MKKYVIGFIFGALIFSGITAYAVTNYLASEVSYNDTTVENALNELYTRTNDYKNLSTETTVDSSKLLNGVTAYNNLGELITGNINIDESVAVDLEIPLDYSNSTLDYNVGFKPSLIYFYWDNGYSWILNGVTVYSFITRTGSDFGTFPGWVSITDTGVSINVGDHQDLKGLSARVYFIK